jgi:hypothetical protein
VKASLEVKLSLIVDLPPALPNVPFFFHIPVVPVNLIGIIQEKCHIIIEKPR